MAASDKFTPYFGPIYSLMRVLLGQPGEQELLLRARAMECVGLMNLAVGRAHCEPVLAECTELALCGLELALPELTIEGVGTFLYDAEGEAVGVEHALFTEDGEPWGVYDPETGEAQEAEFVDE